MKTHLYSNSRIFYLISFLVILLIFIVSLLFLNGMNGNIKNNNKNNLIEGFNETNTIELDRILTNDPPIYINVFKKNENLPDILKLNLRIDPLRRDFDFSSPNKKPYQRLLIPLHIITMLDGSILALFNDGKLYKKNNLLDDQLWTGPLNNSLYGNENDGIPMRQILLFPLNHKNERQIKLFGVGVDGFFYYKETENIQSKWIKNDNPRNNNLIYLFCDYHQGIEDTEYSPLLYGINGQGEFVIKTLVNGENPPFSIEDNDFIPLPFNIVSPRINSNIKVIKVYWDRNGFMIGIGEDLRLYQKKGIDWKVRPWEIDETMRGNNEGSNTKVIDIIMDSDARMVGIVLDDKGNEPMIRIRKQEHSYYLSDFKNPSALVHHRKVYSDMDLLKFKTGLDWTTYLSIEDPDEVLYRTNNLQAINQRNVMKDKLRLRNLCNSRNPNINLETRNFELENEIKKRETKLNRLNTQLGELLELE
jgi:cupin superfamily acireductone dioxygenase involved in methionine salvage